MASAVRDRVHIVPGALDFERAGKIFDETNPDRVYILTNSSPIEEHKKVNDRALEGIQSLVKEKTMCRDDNSLKVEETDFYNFDQALVDCYEIIHKEDLQGNEVIVNLSGGTKPLAIALAFACSLNDTGLPVYYVAKEYEEIQGEVVGKGVADISIEVSPLNLLGMTDILPSDQEKEEIVQQLLKEDRPMGVTKILVTMGRIKQNPPDNEEDKSERNRIVQRYHRHATELFEDGTLTKENRDYTLTQTGRLIARIVTVKKNVEREIEEQRTLPEYDY